MIVPLEQIKNPEHVNLEGKEFLVAQIPAFTALGMSEAIQKSNIAALPQDVILRLLAFVYVSLNGQYVSLDNEVIINQQIQDISTGTKLALAVIRKNFSFLFDGGLLKELEAMFPSEDKNTTKM